MTNKTIIVTQIRSSSKLKKNQKKSLKGLGLRKIGHSSNLKLDSSIEGMIKSARHVLRVL